MVSGNMLMPYRLMTWTRKHPYRKVFFFTGKQHVFFRKCINSLSKMYLESLQKVYVYIYIYFFFKLWRKKNHLCGFIYTLNWGTHITIRLRAFPQTPNLFVVSKVIVVVMFRYRVGCKKNQNIEKITFKIVQMKSLAMHITNKKMILDIFTIGNLHNIFMEHNLYLIS